MHDLYLVVEAPEGILVIDQHALHERILFEQLKTRLSAGRLEVQKLLIPEPVRLPAAQAALLLSHQEALQELGLEVSDFGAGTVLLGGYPALLGKRPPREILQAVVDYLAGKDRPPTREALLNDLMALMACHAAVPRGRPSHPGGDRRAAGAAAAGAGFASLPARAAVVAHVHEAGFGPAVPPAGVIGGIPRRSPALVWVPHRAGPLPSHFPLDLRWRAYHCQSSIDNPGTRLNSEVLCVTRIRPFAKAMAAIIRSFGPISVPRTARCARTFPYS